METVTTRTKGSTWWIGLVGLALVVFFFAALSGPGRIDIVDGQTRYEVARSLLEHGDPAIRNPDVWFNVFPGREGRSYTRYRLPQSLLGVPLLALADATGPTSEERRHFFFVLGGAAAAALLAVVYALWFSGSGLSPASSLVWALLGIVCTPSWFYATSTFDDLLCAAAVVPAIVVAGTARSRPGLGGHLLAGLLLGVAFHCKEPMGAFVFAVLGAGTDPGEELGKQGPRRLAVLAGLAVGLLAYGAYELYKFPLASRAEQTALLEQYVPLWPAHPLAALAGLLVSPGKGVLWYCPVVVLGVVGLRWVWRRSRWEVWGLVASAALYVGFLACLSFFSGDPSWGPRYLTPLLAVLWLYAPWGARRLGRGLSIVLLASSLLIQAASVAVDPHRLYVERGLPSAFYFERPWLYFHPAISHLLNRPREITEILVGGGKDATEFSPAPTPTSAFPILDRVPRGPRAVRRYAILSSLRPWWASFRHLVAADRPVDLRAAAVVQLSGLLAGAAVLVVAGRRLGWGREGRARERGRRRGARPQP